MILINGNEKIELKNKGSVIESWLDYARKSQKEIEQIMLGSQTMLYTQKDGTNFYIAFFVKDDTSTEFGDYKINLSGNNDKELLAILKLFHTEIQELGVNSFIEKHIKDFM